MSSTTLQQDHDLQWNDSLQDWLDGDLSAAEAGALEAHLAGCEACQALLAQLRGLDSSLLAAAPRLELDMAFDQRLFAQIDAIDDTQFATFRGQGGEELIIAAIERDGATLVTGSSYLFDAQIARFFTTLPPFVLSEQLLPPGAGVPAAEVHG